jgi:hypothetical protein
MVRFQNAFYVRITFSFVCSASRTSSMRGSLFIVFVSSASRTSSTCGSLFIVCELFVKNIFYVRIIFHRLCELRVKNIFYVRITFRFLCVPCQERLLYPRPLSFSVSFPPLLERSLCAALLLLLNSCIAFELPLVFLFSLYVLFHPKIVFFLLFIS